MITGGLFTQYYLRDGIRQTDAYQTLDAAAVEDARLRLRRLWRALAAMPTPSEAETEDEFIYPVLRELGWDWLVQPIADGRRRDVADALLFLSPQAKDAARPLQPVARFAHGAVIVENEARRTALDRASAGREAPASQILRYMSRAEVQPGSRVQWGLLTNGGTWRLYFGRARSRSEGFAGVNLADLLEPPPLAPVPVPADAPPDHWFRVFLLLFRRAAFEPQGPADANFLDDAMSQGRTYEERVTEALSAAVFDRVFLRLIRAFAEHDPQADAASADWRAEAREGAIRLLYRLLFLLYAEDRDLLPVRQPGYQPYSLHRLRQEAAELVDNRTVLSARATQRWGRLADLTQAVAMGDANLGLPAYNGGLFQNRAGDLLDRTGVPDADLVPIIDDMSRELRPGAGRRWINYRDLSVQHLGSIYEKLLEQDVIEDVVNGVDLQPSPYARKASGSFYTREELVALILRRAVEPLVQECREGFAAHAHDAEDAAALAGADAAEAMLNLRICDPAMGSGHFLVSLIDHLTDAVLTAMAEAALELDGSYRSPLAAAIVDIRSQILANAATHGWTVLETGLDDRHIVRRMVLKRCVFGVDVNPMAVELAKLSLWLHSFTVGAPLSFLDHHLRCGDSLFGEFVGKAVSRLRDEYGLALSSAVASAEAAAAGMAEVEARADADIVEVHASRDAFLQVEAQTRPLRAFLDLYHASRWLVAEGDADKMGRRAFFGGGYGDAVAIAGGAPMNAPRGDAADARRASRTRPAITARPAYDAAARVVAEARALIAEGRFLAWIKGAVPSAF